MYDNDSRAGSTGPSMLDRLFEVGTIVVFTALLVSVGEAIYLYLR